MKCIYCDENYYKNSSIYHIYFTKDRLCLKCRESLVLDPGIISHKEMKVRTYYLYDDHFSDLLLQYKECYDEALKDVFFYPFISDIRIRYHGYTIITVPSSKSKLKSRGFDHMAKMCECLKLKRVDALEKIDDTSQTLKSFDDRQKMISNIRLKANITLPDKILLIDDVMTTGASLLGAYRLLKGYKVKVIALAHTDGHILKKAHIVL